MSSAKWRPFILGLNVLRNIQMCHSYIVYIIPDDDLVLHQARTSVSTVWTQFAQNILGHVGEGLTHWPLGNLNEIFKQILVIDG